MPLPDPPQERLQRTAALARIALDPCEAPALARDLERALVAWSNLRSVDTAGTEPLWSVAVETGPERADRVAPSLERGELLANSPTAQDGLLRAPDALGGAR